MLYDVFVTLRKNAYMLILIPIESSAFYSLLNYGIYYTVVPILVGSKKKKVRFSE